MQLNPDSVYLVRREIAAAEAPFEEYRQLALEVVKGVDIPWPQSGKVLIKPNATVLFPPEKRVITHPGFVGGLLDGLLEAGVQREQLVVAEGQSGENPKEGHTWEKSGYAPMLRDRQVPLVSLNGAPTRPVQVPGGVVFEAFPLTTEVADCAFFINAPLAKCHNLGCTTLNIKNLMGILVSPERHFCVLQEVDKPHEEGIWRLSESGLSHFEDRFYHKLCDLLAALRHVGMPRLCVVDGLVGRDGTAFNEGENYPLGWSLVGHNEVHVDAVATYLMGLDPEETPYLRFAAQRGLGKIAVDQIEVVDLAADKPFGKD